MWKTYWLHYCACKGSNGFAASNVWLQGSSSLYGLFKEVIGSSSQHRASFQKCNLLVRRENFTVYS